MSYLVSTLLCILAIFVECTLIKERPWVLAGAIIITILIWGFSIYQIKEDSKYD